MKMLKFYVKERKLFHKEFYDITLTKHETLKITKKICRHFKFRQPALVFKYNTDRGLAKLNSGVINLPKSPNLGILLHELAHIYNYEKLENFHHNKKLMKTLNKFVNYCRKKNYWVKPGKITQCPKCEQISPNPNANYCIFCGSKLGFKGE